MAHTCNPSTLGGRGEWITRSRDRDHPGQHGETPSLLKMQKISWAWWCVPVIPATREAEAGELPEPRRQRLRWAEMAPLHSSLGNKSETLSQKKKKKEKERNVRVWRIEKFWNSHQGRVRKLLNYKNTDTREFWTIIWIWSHVFQEKFLPIMYFLFSMFRCLQVYSWWTVGFKPELEFFQASEILREEGWQ